MDYWEIREVGRRVARELLAGLEDGSVIGLNEIEAACDAALPDLNLDDRDMLLSQTCRFVVVCASLPKPLPSADTPA